MGTSKAGRILSSKGSGRTVSEYAIVHSNEGTFTKPRKKGDKLRLKSGGHGQKGMDLLDKYHIKYNIVKIWANGVRVGNIPTHKSKSKQTGIGQSWFPKEWTVKDIKKAGEHVTGLKENRHKSDGVIIFGNYKGVRVGVMKTNGRISTIFPDSNQRFVLRKGDKK